MQIVLSPTMRCALAILLGMFALATMAAAQGPQSVPEELRRKAAEGEECIVCGKLIIDGQVVELRMAGRTVFVDAMMLEDFLGDPERYFQKMRAKSALFDEIGVGGGLGPWPFWIGVYLLTGLVFAAFCGYLAVSSGISPVPWFFAGLVGNVAAVFVLLAARRGDPAWNAPPGLAKVPTTVAPSACHGCGSTNHPAADRCAGCGATLAPAKPSEAALLRGSRS